MNSDRPRLLMVLDHTPDPVDRGEKFRTRKVLEAVAQRFAVEMICIKRANENCPRALAESVGATVCWSKSVSRGTERLLRLMGMAMPVPNRAFFQKAIGLQAALARRTREFGLSLLENTYAYDPRMGKFRFVNDLMGIESEYYKSLAETVRGAGRRFYYKWEHSKIVAHEARVWNNARGNVFLSNYDRQCAANLGYAGRTAETVISQGIDFEDEMSVQVAPEQRSDLLFCGNLTQPRNTDPLIEFIPRIRAGIAEGRLPKDFRMLITGKGSPERLLRECDGKNIVHLGFVPLLVPYLVGTRCMYCYLPGGSGVKTKIVEGFGYGKPVICDELSAKALPELFSISPIQPVQSYEDAYRTLLGIEGIAAGALADVRKHAREHYSWTGLMRRFVTFLESIHPDCHGQT